MLFGQLVIGPPGSGKTTYCHGMQQFMESLGRKVSVVNIDPANDVLPYKCSADVSSLITLTDVMDNMKLGPNGGLIYCMEFLEANFQWLYNEINKVKDHYVIIDCPGQVELYTHHPSVKNIVNKLVKMDIRLCAVHLVDSHYCTDPGKFVSVLLTSLSTMLQVELPYIHILSKADLMEKNTELQFNLEFYTEVLNLEYLLNHLADDPFTKKYKKLNEALIGLVEDYSLVSYFLLNIKDKKSVYEVLKAVDKANGYIFCEDEEKNIQTLLSSAVGADSEYFKNANIDEQLINTDSGLSTI